MKQAKISELRDRLSYFLRRVREGETIEVLDRETPIARLMPLRPGMDERTGWIKRLERSGLVKLGPMTGVREILDRKPSARKTGVLDALLEERRKGR